MHSRAFSIFIFLLAVFVTSTFLMLPEVRKHPMKSNVTVLGLAEKVEAAGTGNLTESTVAIKTPTLPAIEKKQSIFIASHNQQSVCGTAVAKNTTIKKPAAQKAVHKKGRVLSGTTNEPANLTANYYDYDGGVFINGSKTTTVTLHADSLAKSAFVRVINSYDKDLPALNGWKRLSQVSEFQATTLNRKPIASLKISASVLVHIDTDLIGSNLPKTIRMFYFDSDDMKWHPLDSALNSITQTVTAPCKAVNVRFAVFGK